MGKWITFIIIVCLLCIAEWIREIYSFKVTHYHIHSSKLNGLKETRKVILLSDLHNNCYGKENEKLLEEIRNVNPDFIFVAGDMLVGKEGDSAEVAEKLAEQLSQIAPVYYGNGNHEQRMKEHPEKYGDVYEKYREKLVNCGVHFLENEKADLLWDGISVHVYGMEIPEICYTRGKKASLKKDEMEQLIGKASKEDYNILLAHNPTFTTTYLKWGADLSLSGHLHGGVVRIPYLGGVITPQMKLFPKYSGELTIEGESAVVVSKGLGTHTIKIRFLNPAELIVLHLGGEV